ncbi:MAG: transglutaminase domain-containing protein [Chloroflexi bacterium]|nr:transglutaminase domain-containing protein [Chloroflexota bacterium]
MRAYLAQMLSIFLIMIGLAACRADAPVSPQPTPTPPAATLSATATTARYEIVQRLRLINDGPGQPEKQNLWIALLPDDGPQQHIRSRSIQPASYQRVVDEYGNQYAEFDLSHMPQGSSQLIELRYEVEVHRQVAEFGDCIGPLPTIFLQPELHIESRNPQIMALAARLGAGHTTPCAIVRAFYDYIGDTLTYSYNGQNWGAQAAMGNMGADCTEYASLLVALSRAAGIPARYAEGLVYLTASEGGLARTAHAWAEVYLPGAGWTSIDPTLGRGIFLRDTYFGQLPPNHILVTRGRHPSTLRGASYWTHLYWPGASTTIRVQDDGWEVRLLGTTGD